MWILGVILVASLGFNAYGYYQMEKMRFFVGLVDQKDRLQQQQMNDMTLIAINRTNDNIVEVARQQGKIEGMLAIMSGQKPDANEANQIWHAGYYRGLDQSKDMKAMSPTEDTMPATEDKKKK